MLHLYTVRPCTCSLWPSYLRPDRFQPLAVPCCSLRSLSVRPRGRARSARLLPCCSLRSPAPVLLAALACPRACVRACARCARLCVRLLMPGQRWTFLSAVPVWPALLARVWPSYLRPDRFQPLAAVSVSRTYAPVVRAYIVASPAVLLLAVLLSPPAANFFEIVFKLSISVQLSSAGMGDAS